MTQQTKVPTIAFLWNGRISIMARRRSDRLGPKWHQDCNRKGKEVGSLAHYQIKGMTMIRPDFPQIERLLLIYPGSVVVELGSRLHLKVDQYIDCCAGTTMRLDILLLPTAGGLTGDASVLFSVHEFLQDGSHYDAMVTLLQGESAVYNYQSLIDLLLVELMPQFKEDCFRFYEGKGKSFANLYPAQVRREIDKQLRETLDFLVSREWTSWANLKTTYKTERNWEPL
jgi:hypothetical protein